MRTSEMGKPNLGYKFKRNPTVAVYAAFVLVAVMANAEARKNQPLVEQAGTGPTWSKVADQDSYFNVVNETPIRYGAGTAWVKTRLTGQFKCEAATFGADPAPGVTKTCESRDSWAPTNGVLAWARSEDSGVAGYRVYYGNAPGSYSQPAGSGIYAGNQSGFTVVGLTAGKTYYFAVTAIDAAGNESPFSNEASKAAP